MKSRARRIGLTTVALMLAPAGLTAQSAWNDARTLALVQRATDRRAVQLADTGLVDYTATAHGYLTFLAQFGEGFTEPPKIVRADELALEVYWHAPNLSKQRIIGRRDTLQLPTDIRYHTDHLGILQNNFPSIIRIGEGDEVRDVPHPLSATGLTDYDFAISDSLEIRLGASTLQVYEVRVRPKNDMQPRTVGAIYINRETAEVVRMTLGFTRAALMDKDLDDVTVVLENGLIEGRFWVPRRQEIEIRRTASWMDYPARGIIRGRWEICCYKVNAGVPVTYFAGPEITIAPAPELAQYRFHARILDSLPSDVRAVTDADVRRVQEEARALVRAQSLARPSPLRPAAAGVSDFVRFNRVEGLALGTGLEEGVGNGFVARGSARYGISDKAWKGTLSIGFKRGNGATASLFARRDYADVSDEPETSRLRNSIAAQEFGSDYTDLYDARTAGIALSIPTGGNWIGIEGVVERQGAVKIHARPATGRFQPTIDALPLRERRLTLSLTHPTSLTALGFEASGRLALAGIANTYVPESLRLPSVFRPSLSLDLERPLGDDRLVLHTLAAGVSGGAGPIQHRVFLGGPVTGPGYDFHQFVARRGLSQRLEWRFPVPFFSIPLGRYGKVPGAITVAPYLHEVWVSDPQIFTTHPGGWFPSAGVGAITLFDVLRFDVAKGFRRGRWTFSVDAGREFWSVL